MDVNANANPIAPHQPGAPEPIFGPLQRCNLAIALNMLLSGLIVAISSEKDDPNAMIHYKEVFGVSCLLGIIHIFGPELYAWMDQACQPRVKSWVAAFLMSALGTVYPACLCLLSKKRWIVILGWVMLAVHVVSTVLQYYFYLSVKGFGQKSVNPLPPETEENV